MTRYRIRERGLVKRPGSTLAKAPAACLALVVFRRQSERVTGTPAARHKNHLLPVPLRVTSVYCNEVWQR
ncbi:hypothetical protein E2C01_007957 [Portunus trituberculatus]|uniref:Uncharacterized protein n=1 Tax=Portunus trituberculatus TaxID=210409 RepID=A0A5B7D506_PORTR|nr:hypothetical protein [Portunus trituberculatus]